MIQRFRQTPRGKYNGLAIIFSYPSRFDMQSGKLLTGFAGIFFQNTACNGVLLGNSFIDIVDNFLSPNMALPEGTKVVLLLGTRAMNVFLKERNMLIDFDIRLDQQRGSPVVDGNITYICSYLPQDAMDFKAAYEKDHNTYLSKQDSKETAGITEGEEDNSEEDSKSTKGATSRQNYRFWLEKDCQKSIAILSGRLSTRVEQPPFVIYPAAEAVLSALRSRKNEHVYFDIETDANRKITCFGFSFDSMEEIYVVPLLRYNYYPAYSEIPEILIALAIALRDNTCVGHNISGFDLFVLAHDYHIPPGKRNYDTMLAHHRCFPEIEKSLGHCISLYTTLPYHKNEGAFNPHSETEELQLWQYNAKDVWTLKLVKAGIDKEAQRIFAVESIKQVNRQIIPYLTMSLMGIRYDPDLVTTMVAENDKKLNALLRILEYLIGFSFLPTSNKQCVNYFHSLMDLPAIKRSKKTDKPSLDEASLYKLAVKSDHPIIPITIFFRQTVKETGTLKFIPWKESINDKT